MKWCEVEQKMRGVMRLRGANLRDLQAVLGHKNLETTMTYLTPEIERLTSPLELLSA